MCSSDLLETLTADKTWDERSFVIAKPDGGRYSLPEANESIAELFAGFDLPSITTLDALRHPALA